MNIGERIKEVRKSNNMTQKELSKKMCVQQSYISGIENGKETPSDMFLKLFSLEFNIDLQWLYGRMPKIQQFVYGDGWSIEEENGNFESGLTNSLNELLLTLKKYSSKTIYNDFTAVFNEINNIIKDKTVNQAIVLSSIITSLLLDIFDILNYSAKKNGCYSILEKKIEVCSINIKEILSDYSKEKSMENQ